MPSSVHSKDKQPFKSHLVESAETSRPSSAEEATTAENPAHHDEETGNEIAHTGEKPFDIRSTKTTESVIPPPPDGGLHAWLKVFGGFMIYVRIMLSSERRHLTNLDQHLGLHIELRGFSSLLQVRPSRHRIPFSNIVDWYRAGVASHLLRRFVRSIVRLGLLPRYAYCGQLLGCVRHHDA